MGKQKQTKHKKEELSPYSWALRIFLIAIALSAALSLLSETTLAGADIAMALLILGLFILLGIAFDILGVAVTAADERPFHSAAAHREKGAKESLWLLRRASYVSSFCNDVVGDICGVVSGSASATIAAQVLARIECGWPQAVTLLMSAMVAGLTVGGKAVGKTIAMASATSIVHGVGRILFGLRHIPELFRKKKNKR